jgi:pimeloyl-ACP methyl ester carboxylesterase
MTLHPGRVSAAVLQAPMGAKPIEGEILDQFLWAAPDYVRNGFADESMYDELFGEELDENQLFAWELNRETFTRIGWKPYGYNPALPHLLALVDAPVLLCRGSADRIVPTSVVDRFVECLPNATATQLDGGGHFLELEQPSKLAQLAREFCASVV